MDWITGIQSAINYIEDHITEPIDYEQVAKQSFSSSFHFQRVFSILCGDTWGEYIRNRRLSLAGTELAAGRDKVIDVAAKYGYDSPDSFTKAFQRFHGIAPSQARGNGAMLKSFSRLSLKISLEGGSIMNYRIEKKPEMVLTGFKRRFSGVPENREAQEEDFYVHTRPNQYLLNDLTEYPADNYNIVTNIDDEGYDFYIATQIPDGIRARLHEDCVLGAEYADRFEHVHIAPQTYVIFETERAEFPHMHHMELRRRIVSEWLPTSGYELSDAPEITLVHWYPKPDTHKRYIELWLPIVKK